MARDYMMSWDDKNERWYKRTPLKYLPVADAKVMKVSCRQLDTPSTKSGSYRAANDWWRSKIAEWELALGRVRESEFPVASEDAHTLEQMAAWLRDKGQIEESKVKSALARKIRQSIQSGSKPSYSDREIYAIGDWDQATPEDFQARYTSDVDVWHDRLDQNETVPVDKTVKVWVETFLDILRPKTTPQTMPNIERQLCEFTDWQGEETSIESIDEITVRSFFSYLQSNEKADSTNRDTYSTWNRWVSFLVDERQIERPRNLHSKELRFSVSHVATAPDREELVRFLCDLEDKRIRLYALLCLNCAMNNADIGQLHNTEFDWRVAEAKLQEGLIDCGHIDWSNKRLVRQRQKTKGKGKVPTVCYPLWDETFKLLEEFRSEDQRYCLLTTTDTPLWMRGEKRKDAVYDRRWKALKTLTPKDLRAGGATILGGHKTYKLYTPQYLADSVRGIPDRHYVVPSQKLFDAAIKWLGKQLDVK